MGQLNSALRSQMLMEYGGTITPPNGDGITPSLASAVTKPIEDWKGYVKDLVSKAHYVICRS